MLPVLWSPVVVLKTWLEPGRIGHGPVFCRVIGKSKLADVERLNDRHIARLVKQTAVAAGGRNDLTEGERFEKFSGHSLRAGLATSAEVEERYIQKQLGHTSAEMTRKYQRRRDRFRVLALTSGTAWERISDESPTYSDSVFVHGHMWTHGPIAAQDDESPCSKIIFYFQWD